MDQKHKDMMLIIRGPNFMAGAVMEYRGKWRWTAVAPIIAWIRHREMESLAKWLQGPARALGWTYEWRTL